MRQPEVDAPATRAFFRALRHDLRTPINHIIGYSELLLEECADGEPLSFTADLARIRRAGRDLLALINDSLDPAKAEAGQVDFDVLSRDIRTPLNAIVGYSDLLQEEAAELGLASYGPDLGRIHQAGTQLLSLVGAVLHISEVAPDRARVATRTLDPPAPDPIPPDPIHTATAEPGRVLVVDDDPSNRDLLARRLLRLGYRVAQAEDGQTALDRLAAEPFDLVLLDVVMPGLDGYRVLQRLKADERLRHVPVIVLSASDETEAAVRCIGLGAEDYLPKPFDAVLLRARIGASLEKKRLRDQEARYLRQIEAEKQRADELLHVILPGEIVAELVATNTVKPRRRDNVAVMFCDVVGFTSYCDRRPPHAVIPSLQQLVEACEDIALEHGLQKIKTIGDSFMAACGLLAPVEAPVLPCVRAGQAMIEAARRLPAGWDVRVGVEAGPVVAGVLGRRQYLFDVFGDTVNTAARVESAGVPGAVTLGEAAWRQVADHCRAEPLGAVQVKGKGQLSLYRVLG